MAYFDVSHSGYITPEITVEFALVSARATVTKCSLESLLSKVPPLGWSSIRHATSSSGTPSPADPPKGTVSLEIPG